MYIKEIIYEAIPWPQDVLSPDLDVQNISLDLTSLRTSDDDVCMSRDRILILRTGGLGDSLLLWPAIAGIRRRFPKAQIDCMGNQSRLALLCTTSGADSALDVNGSGLHLLFDDSPELPTQVRDRFGAYTTAVAFQAAGDFTLAQNLADCGIKEVHAFLPFPPEEEPAHVADHCLGLLVKVGLAKPGPVPALSFLGSRKKNRSHEAF